VPENGAAEISDGIAQLLLDTEQLIILGYQVRAPGRAGLDLYGV